MVFMGTFSLNIAYYHKVDIMKIHFMEDPMKKLLITLVALLSLGSTVAYAHSGRTDSQGCHVDSKTGIRHCH